MNVSVPDQASISRATSRASGRSRNGSSMSRNQSLIKKNIQLHDLKPADVLIERFVAWKAIVQQLTAYFEGIADIETNTAKELTKLAGVIQVPFRAGNQFLGEGGLQDVFYNIRDKTRTIADQHADLGRTVDSSIVQHLQKLRAEIKAHIKNVQNDTGKLAAGVAKEREISTRLVGELANDISTFKNTPMNIAAKNDPYVANQAVARQLQRQVLEENLLQKSLIMMQQNSAHFEEGIVRSIQSAWQTFDEWQSRASVASQDIFRSLSTSLTSLTPDREWIQFAARSDHLVDPETPLRDPELVTYPLKEDPSVLAVHSGHMERKKRFTRAYSECYFVLTPAGFLHEFSTSDPNSPSGLVPTFSLFLPSCTLGPVSSPHSKNHKFHIEGRKDGLGTTKSKSGSFKGLLGRGGGDGGQKAWSFRLRSREDMLEWWNDIKMLCARYLVASEQVERPGPVHTAVMSVGYAPEEEEEGGEEEGSEESSVEEEVDREPFDSYDHDHAPPIYTVPEKSYPLEIGRNGYAIEKKDQPIPNHYPTNGGYDPQHAPSNVDDATMDPTSDEQPSTRRSRRLSKRQMEKAPAGVAEDYQEHQRHSPVHVDRERPSSPRQQPQHSEDHILPPPLPYGIAPTTSPSGPRFVPTTKASSANGDMKKGAIIPSHVGGRHLSPPPPHPDTEIDGEEVTGDGDDNDEDDDMYTDDEKRDVKDQVRYTEPGTPGSGEVGAVPAGEDQPSAEGFRPGEDEPEGYLYPATSKNRETDNPVHGGSTEGHAA